LQDASVAGEVGRQLMAANWWTALTEGAAARVARLSTASLDAAARGDAVAARRLLAKGADVNAKNHDGDTALIVALKRAGHAVVQREVVQALIDLGADVNAKSHDGDTALILALKKDHSEVVHAMIDLGAEVNAKSHDGDTALIIALKGARHAIVQREVVQALIAKGADVNAESRTGEAALLIATKGGQHQVVRALIDLGANVNAKNHDGDTALILALKEGRSEIVHALIDAGADVDAKNRHGETALTVADAWHRGESESALYLRKGNDAANRERLAKATKSVDQKQLFKVAKTAGNPEIRRSAVRAMKDQALCTDIAKNDPDSGVRWEAVWGGVRDPVILTEIARQDSDPNVRALAVKGLVKADESVLMAFTSNEVHPKVREAAIETLRKIQSRDYFNREWNFGLAIPNGWEITFENKDGHPWMQPLRLVGPKASRGRPFLSVLASIAQEDNKGLRAYMRKAESDLSGEFANFALDNKRETDLLGFPVAWMTYSYQTDLGPRSEINATAFFGCGRMILFQFICETDSDRASVDFPLFESIIKSFWVGRAGICHPRLTLAGANACELCSTPLGDSKVRSVLNLMRGRFIPVCDSCLSVADATLAPEQLSRPEQVAILRVLSKDEPANLPPVLSATDPASKASAPAFSPLSYVESVFDFDWAETPDPRDWRKFDELKDVPDLFHDDQIVRVEAKLDDALIKFPDYSFVYIWKASVFEKKEEIERARQTYTEGLRVSKARHGLCGRLAMLEFEHGTLKEAVRWWIRSIYLQMHGGSVDDAQSFLYLAFVALLNQQDDASSKLMDASAKGPHGTIALSSRGKQNVSNKVNAEPYGDIRAAIQELTARRWSKF
jgi:ankyrin repeat protein